MYFVRYLLAISLLTSAQACALSGRFCNLEKPTPDGAFPCLTTSECIVRYSPVSGGAEKQVTLQPITDIHSKGYCSPEGEPQQPSWFNRLISFLTRTPIATNVFNDSQNKGPYNVTCTIRSQERNFTMSFVARNDDVLLIAPHKESKRFVVTSFGKSRNEESWFGMRESVDCSCFDLDNCLNRGHGVVLASSQAWSNSTRRIVNTLQQDVLVTLQPYFDAPQIFTLSPVTYSDNSVTVSSTGSELYALIAQGENYMKSVHELDDRQKMLASSDIYITEQGLSSTDPRGKRTIKMVNLLKQSVDVVIEPVSDIKQAFVLEGSDFVEVTFKGSFLKGVHLKASHKYNNSAALDQLDDTVFFVAPEGILSYSFTQTDAIRSLADRYAACKNALLEFQGLTEAIVEADTHIRSQEENLKNSLDNDVVFEAVKEGISEPNIFVTHDFCGKNDEILPLAEKPIMNASLQCKSDYEIIQAENKFEAGDDLAHSSSEKKDEAVHDEEKFIDEQTLDNYVPTALHSSVTRSDMLYVSEHDYPKNFKDLDSEELHDDSEFESEENSDFDKTFQARLDVSEELQRGLGII